MKRFFRLHGLLLVFLAGHASGRGQEHEVSPDSRKRRVFSERELQEAVGQLSDGDEILLEPGVYRLTQTLCVRANHVTIRGVRDAAAAVVLMGRGMENKDYGFGPHAIWCDARSFTLADLTVRDFYWHGIILHPGAEHPRIERVRFIDIGGQFVKANPRRFGSGVDGGIIRDSTFVYEKGPPCTDHGGGTGYTNAIDVHAGRNWIIQGNFFASFHTDDRSDCLWNPAILMWNGAGDTLVQGNVFVNVDRAIAFGLEPKPGGPDHRGGIICQNLIVNEAGLFSPGRRAESDAAILVWNSPGTAVFGNTILANGNQRLSIEFRFDSRGSWAGNNLTDAPIGFRSP